MADKIILKKEDIEAGMYELPEGYEFRTKATREMLIQAINKAIADLKITQGEAPSNAELIVAAKIGIHPYYEAKIRLERLNKELKNYE